MSKRCMAGTFLLLLSVGLASNTSMASDQQIQQAKILTDADKSATVQVTDMSTEFAGLFGTSGCELPASVKSKLNLTGKEGVVPAELQLMLGDDYHAKASDISNLTAIGTLHQIQITMQDGSEKSLRLAGSDSYSTSNPMSFVDTAHGNVMYTMDCAGYLNAALAATSSFWGIKAQAAAQSALKSQIAFAVIDADLFSPVALAMDPGLSTIQLPRSMRIDLLYAIEHEALSAWPSIPDTTEIRTWREVHMIWASNEGRSSFNGSASLSSSASEGFAGVNLQGGGGMGGSLTRSITFSSFHTYILDDAVLDVVKHSSGDLRSELMTLVAETQASDGDTTHGGVYAIFKDIPKSICVRSWTAAITGGTASSSTVQAYFDSNGCRFTVRSNATLTGHSIALASQSDLKPSEKYELTFEVD